MEYRKEQTMKETYTKPEIKIERFNDVYIRTADDNEPDTSIPVPW